MSEENKIYVIKYRGYWYDDEYYSPRDWGCSMCHLFYNKEEAIEQWKILENDFLMQHDYDILDYEEANSDLSQLNLDHLNPQIKEKLLYTLRYDEILTNDEIFGLMVDLGRNIYQLEEYPKNLNYYILWFPDKNHYAMSIDTTEYDTQSNISLDIRLSVEQDEYLKYPYPDYISTIELNGSLDALSDSPRLLSKLIEYNSNIKYDEKREVLKVTLNTETVNSVNALLKKPFFEIRCLSIEEIFKIEKQLNSTYPKPISGN